MTLDIRFATSSDVELLAEMADAFNVEDGQPPGRFTPEAVRRDGFERREFRALIAWDGDRALGYALICPIYNTELAAPGLWMQDLWVRPAHRGAQVGAALLAAVARVARNEDRASVWWGVRRHNERGRAFYARLGAELGASDSMGLEDAALDSLATQGIAPT